MTEAEVLLTALLDGFMLEVRRFGTAWGWAWSRGDDEGWPCFVDRRLAIDWMADRIGRGRVYA